MDFLPSIEILCVTLKTFAVDSKITLIPHRCIRLDRRDTYFHCLRWNIRDTIILLS